MLLDLLRFLLSFSGAGEWRSGREGGREGSRREEGEGEEGKGRGRREEGEGRGRREVRGGGRGKREEWKRENWRKSHNLLQTQVAVAIIYLCLMVQWHLQWLAGPP